MKEAFTTFAPAETLFDEITDFLVSAPSPEEIIAYKPSEMLDNRPHELLDKNQNDHLTSEERKELDRFLEVNH